MSTNFPILLSAGALALVPSTALAAAKDMCWEYDIIPAEDYADEDTSWYHIANNGDMVGNFCSSADGTGCTVGYDSLVWGAIYDAAHDTVEWFQPPEGYNVVQRAGMNESGTVVGTAVDGNGAGGVARAAAFMLVDGVATVFDDPTGYGYYAATDINASGVIAGYSRDDSVFPGGRIGWILYPDGSYEEVEVPGAYRTFPFGINNHGDVAGYFLDGDYAAAGGFIRWADGTYETVWNFDFFGGGTPPWTEYFFYDINENGTVVGTFTEYGSGAYPDGISDTGGIYWPDGGTMEEVHLSGYGYVHLDSINARGTISGDTNTPPDGIVVERTRCR